MPAITEFTVSTEQELRDAIFTISNYVTSGGTLPGDCTITLAADLTAGDAGALLQSLPMIRGDDTHTITIDGDGYTIDADGAGRVFFIESGIVEIDNLTIANANATGGAGGTGEAGGGGGGGGLGAGAVIFVNTGADVTVSNVVIDTASATGGAGGEGGVTGTYTLYGGGGGGGLGGDGGAGGYGGGGGGGYEGAGGTSEGAGAGGGGEFGSGGVGGPGYGNGGGGGGGGQQGDGGSGGIDGGGGGGGLLETDVGHNGSGSGGAGAGGGGAGGDQTLDGVDGANFGGGGGGGADDISNSLPAGDGGDGGVSGGGGGGGYSSGHAGAGGLGGGGGGGDRQDGGAGGDFGGGGGASGGNVVGGAGGFGGGGGGASVETYTGTLGGDGGFGGGGGAGHTAGAGGTYGGGGGAGTDADGGGGAALGGAIFVADGGSLTIKDSTFSGTYGVTGGAGGDGTGGATDGQALGNVMFLHGTAATTIEVSTGTQTIGSGSNGTAGDIAGDGSLTKTGAGTLLLSGSSTYTGATYVTEGVLMAGSDNSFSRDSSYHVGIDGILDLNGQFVTIGSLNDGTGGAGVVTNADTVATTLTLGADDSYFAYFSGVIQDEVHETGLIKTGTGTQILAGTNTYTFGTTVNQGTLQVDGSIQGSTTVKDAATLAGYGQVGSVTVEAGGSSSPGSTLFIATPGPTATIGPLWTGDVDLNAGAHLQIQMGESPPIVRALPNDEVFVTGSVKIGGSVLDLFLVGDFKPTSGDFTIIDNDGSDAVIGKFAGLAEGAVIHVGDAYFKISYVGGDGNDVVLSAFQPSSAVVIFGTGRGDLIDATHTPSGQPYPGSGDDKIFGRGGNDRIHGLAGDDTIVGGRGADRMFGGGGEDNFVFRNLAEVGGHLSHRGVSFLKAAASDHVYQFENGVDTLDFSGFDASRAPGKQDFTFIGKQNFHHKAGELRWESGGHNTVVVSGDINGDGWADFQVKVHGTHVLHAGDLILV